MSSAELRTTSFRLSPAYFGKVFVYKPGDRFTTAWRRLADIKRPRDQTYFDLPDASLRTALTVMSGDFVTLEANRESWAMISRARIGLPDLRRALAAWEFVVWPEGARAELADAVDDMKVERISIVKLLGRRAGRCPSPEANWIWKAATWEVARRLAKEKLLLDHGGMASLHLDSDASLLTWADLRRGGKENDSAAMHIITPRLITIPGLEEPVVHLKSSLVRLPTKWGGWIKNAWIAHGRDLPLLYASVHQRRTASGEWQSVWADLSADVLRRCNIEIPQIPSDVDLSSFGCVRCRMKTAPKWFPIGSGTGQVFHEAVGMHAKKLLPDAIPLEFVKARQTLAGQRKLSTNQAAIEAAVRANGALRFHLTCLYGDDHTRKRMAASIQELFGISAEVNFARNSVETCFGAVTVLFASPPDALKRLSGSTDRRDLESWVVQAVGEPSPMVNAKTIRAAMVETGDPDELRGTDRDPKHVIRRTLAARGIVTQFLSNLDGEQESHDDELATDHRAKRAVWDILRSAGVFPLAFPTLEEITDTMWLVGVYAVQRQNDRKSGYSRKPGAGFVVSVVAVKAGGHEAMGYNRASGWQPLNEFSASFLSSPQDDDKSNAKLIIENAISQLLVREPHSKLIVFMEAGGCRRFWDALSDTKGDDLPRFARADRVGIVRVRTDWDEVPRVAGVGNWPDVQVGPGRPSLTNALYRIKDEQWPGAMYYVSTSPTLNRRGFHRDYTRFSCPDSGLRKNWHAHTMTEFWSPFAGPFRKDALYELSSLLCREAPTWTGSLNRPSPIHLAHGVVLDHPDRYEVRIDEDDFG